MKEPLTFIQVPVPTVMAFNGSICSRFCRHLVKDLYHFNCNLFKKQLTHSMDKTNSYPDRCEICIATSKLKEAKTIDINNIMDQ